MMADTVANPVPLANPPDCQISTGFRTFDSIRGFSGTYEVDKNVPGQPVVSIKLNYEVDDDQLAKLARLLTGFPDLKSLRLKSSHITDAGTAQLKLLPQLKHLSLEETVVTDAGLVHLKALTVLEELNIKGTKVTDAEVEDFQQSLPNAKVQRRCFTQSWSHR